jgi:predicted glycosyltransferase
MMGSAGAGEHTARVLCLVESHEGFGHFNIIDLLSNALQQRNAHVCVASGTLRHPSGVFAFEGAVVAELPYVGYSKSRKVFTQPDGSEYLPDSAYAQARWAAIVHICTHFQPDVVICELFPFMQTFRRGDVQAIREHYAAHKVCPEIVCLGRDIVHNHSASSNTINDLHNLFDRLLIRGDSQLFRLEESQPEWAEIQIPLEYMGVFVEPMPPARPLRDHERPVVVFSGGGYHDQDLPFFINTIASRQYSTCFYANPWDVYVSNNCSDALFAHLSALAADAAPDGKLQVKRPVSSAEFKQIEADCAAAFTRAGYNTTFELASISKPVVVVPRTFKEQVQRAEMLDRAGVAKIVLQDQLLDVVGLGARLDAAAHCCSTALLHVNYHGAAHTADRIVELAQKYRHRMIASMLEVEPLAPLAPVDLMGVPSGTSGGGAHLPPPPAAV